MITDKTLMEEWEEGMMLTGIQDPEETRASCISFFTGCGTVINKIAEITLSSKNEQERITRIDSLVQEVQQEITRMLQEWLTRENLVFIDLNLYRGR